METFRILVEMMRVKEQREQQPEQILKSQNEIKRQKQQTSRRSKKNIYTNKKLANGNEINGWYKIN